MAFGGLPDVSPSRILDTRRAALVPSQRVIKTQ